MAIASPSIQNYTIGKGAVHVRVSGETNFRHIGNCPEFEFTPELEELEHFSSMTGVKSVDRTEVISKKGTLRIVFEEITPENLALALLGDLSNSSGGDQEIQIFSKSSKRCEFKFVGNNDVGPKYEWYFRQVDIIPSGGIQLLSEEWMQIEISGKVAAVSGDFGTVTKFADGT